MKEIITLLPIKWSVSTWILLAILYIFMARRMRSFFWPFFLFSSLFGYDRKYSSRKRSGKWIPIDPASNDFSSDDKDLQEGEE